MDELRERVARKMADRQLVDLTDQRWAQMVRDGSGFATMCFEMADDAIAAVREHDAALAEADARWNARMGRADG